MSTEGVRGGGRRVPMRRIESATTPPVSPPPASGAPAAPVDPAPAAFHVARDMRVRVGVTVFASGTTQTALPKLLSDWTKALHEAAAEERADAEVLAPHLGPALAQAEADKGDKLSRAEVAQIDDALRRRLRQPWQQAFDAHHQEITRSPSTKKQTERDVLLAQRPRLEQLKDPFTPVIQDVPGARDGEIVLWENHNAIVLVDTFAPSPKALVVPKQPATLPLDLAPPLLDEIARIAAHVSDAFMRATGCPAAGIWINPPQHLTVRQMHVHVLPDLPPYAADGTPAKAFLEDARLRPQLEAWFDVVRTELRSKLGAPTR